MRRQSSAVIRRCKELISLGEALVIFPEGNLFYYEPGEVHPLKPGVAWLALNCQSDNKTDNIKIIPIRLVYSERKLRLRSRARIVGADFSHAMLVRARQKGGELLRRSPSAPSCDSGRRR